MLHYRPSPQVNIHWQGLEENVFQQDEHINVSDPDTQNRIFTAGVSIALHPVPPEPERETGRQILIQDPDQML